MKWAVEVITDESSNIVLETYTIDSPNEEIVGMGFPLKLAERIVKMHNTAIDAVISDRKPKDPK